ncbi:MAG: YceI family protein [Paracoccaceae bacterium]
MTRLSILAVLAALAATPALAAAEKYTLDPSHAQIVFSYNHLGYSTGYGMFSGFAGDVMFDKEAPAASSVTVSFPVKTMLTGWEARFTHFMSPEFFDGADDEMVTFTSTAVEVTGETTGKITGDLTLNGVTKSVVLDATLTKAEPYPLPPFDGKPALGFNATTTLLRSDYNLGAFAPFISDEVQVEISFEAMKLD